jgi:hypothetical protein
MLELNILLGVKDTGGVAYLKWQTPFTLVRGSYAKLGIVINDQNNRAFTITSYCIKLRVKKQDGTILEVEAVHIDNSKGEAEFSLSPTQTKAIALGAGQSVEIELGLRSDGEVKTFALLPKVITVIDRPF